MKKKHLFSRKTARVLHDYVLKRYGDRGPAVWKATALRYNKLVREARGHGGRKDPHDRQTYDCILLYAFYRVAGKDLAREDLEGLAHEIFMVPLRQLARLFDARQQRNLDLMVSIISWLEEDQDKDRKPGTGKDKGRQLGTGLDKGRQPGTGEDKGSQLGTDLDKGGQPEEGFAEGPAQEAGQDTDQKTGRPVMRLHFTDQEEAIDLFFANRTYLDGHNQNDYDYRMNKKGTTKEEYEAFARDQILEFSDQEIGLLVEGMQRIKNRFNRLGFSWPIQDPVVFIKTTMREEGDAAAYTHKNQIYLYENYCGYLDDEETRYEFDRILTHELFHLLTRYRPDFRRLMYDVIGFSVGPEPAFSQEVKNHIISNPDVERYDCYGLFTINGHPRECTIVFAAPDYNGEAMFTAAGPALVALDEPDRLIPLEEVEDFYDVIGKNTDYMIGAEECLADNFSYAVTFGKDYDYKTPEIIDRILDILCHYSPEGRETGS